MAHELLIWWTNQADCEAIDAASGHAAREGSLDKHFPRYLCDQYRARYGRNGRGRLWVADEFGEASVDPWPETALGKLLGETPRLGQTYAGIVIYADDAHLFQDMPGIITDFQLRRP